MARYGLLVPYLASGSKPSRVEPSDICLGRSACLIKDHPSVARIEWGMIVSSRSVCVMQRMWSGRRVWCALGFHVPSPLLHALTHVYMYTHTTLYVHVACLCYATLTTVLIADASSPLVTVCIVIDSNC